jgi:ABC-2 type transport system permease protein
VVSGGGDETLRPEHFTLLPLSRGRLAVGLLAASFVGVAAAVSLMAFFGLVVYGLRLGPGAAVVGLLFTGLQLIFVVLAYRVVMAALGALLTSRKGKELGILLAALAGLSGVGINYALSSLGPAIVEGRVPAFAETVRILPSGWGAVAVKAAGDADWATAGLLLAGMLALIAALTAAWGMLLAKRATNPVSSGPVKVRVGKWRGLLPQTPIGAVTAKELRMWWRDTRRRVALLSTLIVGVAVVVGPALYGQSPRLLSAIAIPVVIFACIQAGNLYGLDGSALWHTLVIPGAERADIRGRQLAWALIVTPLGLVLAVVMPAVTGRPEVYPWVLGLLPALIGAGAGSIMLQSVFVAFPLPDPKRNASPFSSGGRPGCSRVLLQLSTLLLLLAGALPVVAIELLGLTWAGVPVGAGMGVLLAWWWGRIAQRRLTERGPELLATVAKEV